MAARLAFAILALLTAGAAPAQQAAQSTEVPLPEAGYQAAVRDARLRFDSAMAACNLVNWSDRPPCEQSARDALDRAETDAKQNYMRSQAEIDKLKEQQAAQNKSGT